MKSALVVFLIHYLYKGVESWVLTDINLANKTLFGVIDENDVEGTDSQNGKMEAKFNLIYPGTKWCGPGDIADNYDDLGTEWRTDKCCRAHDYCPDVIPGGESKYNLTNDAPYTRLSCDCDETFRQCLQNADRFSAENIGKIYFNGIKTQCFKKDYPVLKCLKRGSWPLRKCLMYSYDTNAQEIYQWFDVPDFRS